MSLTVEFSPDSVCREFRMMAPPRPTRRAPRLVQDKSALPRLMLGGCRLLWGTLAVPYIYFSPPVARSAAVGFGLLSLLRWNRAGPYVALTVKNFRGVELEAWLMIFPSVPRAPLLFSVVLAPSR